MKHPLRRILRLRSLLEEMSRLNLELRLRELAQLESNFLHVKQERKNTVQSRYELIKQENSSWQEASLLEAWLEKEAHLLDSVRNQKLLAVDAAKVEYRERRKEYRQIENVIEVKTAVQAIESSRREQQELDDWFGGKKEKKLRT